MTHSSSGLAMRTQALNRHHRLSLKLLTFTLNTAIDNQFGVLTVKTSQTQVICQRSSFVAC